MKASEEKIPVYNQALEVYFVVNCPSLHIVQLGRLGPRKESASSTGLSDFERYPSLYPACGLITTKARQSSVEPYPPHYIQASPESVSQYSSSSFTTSSRIRNPPSPTLPEPIASLGIIDSHLEEFRPAAPSRPLTAPPEQKRNGLFNIKWSGSKTKPERKNNQARSTYSQESNESGLPKFMSFAFALTGRALLVWKKDGETLVRLGLDAPVHQSIA
ncbi:hypothetical protein GGR58DRAFT_313140 [Xylaria digitata]|nr:hypothetical protein GGR58DRAFT_313140 [Xylaria digitata]